MIDLIIDLSIWAFIGALGYGLHWNSFEIVVIIYLTLIHKKMSIDP